ncbi:GrxA family glutaredoxin [Zooshikella marina]|uniref:GrxA family glutaredoxin n=1 Tax=Zooshikella ganghwensis TaxID=202772 RepID=A0A4P9VL83_9GAMM|nr:GrxA family glutaredoxin [Zooshikella ganghwensis]MBU2704491.1 GrxA family glutaredoxin [Zooshikella ganghwensis]RDH43309.1 GrxA family glutaredoxin [Zooshikella ganghwensis]
MQRITIFGREGCGFCRRAKQLCEDKQLDFNYIDIHAENITKADLEKTIGKPVETVPQIFHGKEYIGGCQEFEVFLQQAETH